METPRSERQADVAPADSPGFDALTPSSDLVSGPRTRDDFFDAVLGLESPATASEIADRADHGVDAAREYLEWFERMGIVTQVTDSPVTYERNQSYLNWRRVQTLRENHTTDELVAFLESETERVETLADEFDVESPDEISLSAYAADTGQSIEDVWETISEWKTARRKIRLLERALTAESGDAADQQPAV